MKVLSMFSIVTLVLFSSCGKETFDQISHEENYLEITIDGITKTFFTSSVNQEKEYTIIEAQGAEKEDIISFIFYGKTIGDYSRRNYIKMIRNTTLQWNYRASSTGFANFKISEYGKRIVGSFDGEVKDKVSGELVNASGVFHIK